MSGGRLLQRLICKWRPRRERTVGNRSWVVHQPKRRCPSRWRLATTLDGYLSLYGTLHGTADKRRSLRASGLCAKVPGGDGREWKYLKRQRATIAMTGPCFDIHPLLTFC